jgi:hypothetical protein
MKKCSKCQEIKIFSDFAKIKIKQTGFRTIVRVVIKYIMLIVIKILKIEEIKLPRGISHELKNTER